MTGGTKLSTLYENIHRVVLALRRLVCKERRCRMGNNSQPKRTGRRFQTLPRLETPFSDESGSFKVRDFQAADTCCRQPTIFTSFLKIDRIYEFNLRYGLSLNTNMCSTTESSRWNIRSLRLVKVRWFSLIITTATQLC